MVEVTKAPSGSLFSKISSFEQDYIPRIKDQLQRHHVVRGDDAWAEWTVGLWVFAPAVTLPGLKTRMQTANVQEWRTTSLEETPIPDWEARFR